MPNNPDIPDTGRIQRNQSQTMKEPKLEYETDVRRDDRFGAKYDPNLASDSIIRAQANARVRRRDEPGQAKAPRGDLRDPAISGPPGRERPGK